MRLLSFFRSAIRESDFFSSSEMLRFHGDLEYRTLTGGVLSIAILITVIIGFASMILDTISLSSITTQKIVNQASSPTALNLTASPQGLFMFGIGINAINLSAPVRYFDIFLELYQQSNTVVQQRVQLPLEQCTRQHWTNFPDLLQKFDTVGVANWLCPHIGTIFTLEGAYTTATYSQYMIRVTACNNATDPSRPCASQAEIKAQSFNNKSFYYFTLYYSNPIINADQKDFIGYYLEDRAYVMFGDSVATQNYLYFSDYVITTDSSIWPYEKEQQLVGAIVEDPSNKCNFQTTKNGPFVLFNLVKSPRSITYNRSVQKISSVFSFIGGLVSAAYTALFLLKKYSSLAYEFSISEVLFQPEGEVEKEEWRMNIIQFFKYGLYLLSVRMGKVLNWPRINYMHDCRLQILKQIDVKTLLKRIIFMEHCLTYLFEDFQLSGLQMHRPTSHIEIRQLREKCESVVRSFNPSDESQISQKPPNQSKRDHESSYIDVNCPPSLQEEVERKPTGVRLHKITEARPKQLPSILILDMVSNNEDLSSSNNKVRNLGAAHQSKIRESLLRKLVDNARQDNISRKILENIASHNTNLKFEELSFHESK